MLLFSELEKICHGKNVQFIDDRQVTTLVIDSRKAIATPGSVFFAISGPRHNGHQFMDALYASGIHQFVVDQPVDISKYPSANIVDVKSVILALQDVVASHRNSFNLPVIGITGSNAKTIVKEWLYQLLAGDFSIVKNPGSYNSQIGVPLSVWPLNAHHQLGIFEAGISLPGEMARLAQIIRPSIGIFTNLGPAHAEGFASPAHKLREKLRLFETAQTIIYCKDHKEVAAEIEAAAAQQQKLMSWGYDEQSALRIEQHSAQTYNVRWEAQSFLLSLPFSDPASTENAFHCVTAMLCLGYSLTKIQERITSLRTVPMRLELKQGINGCQIIDDTYNNDLSGLQISLDFLSGIRNKNATLILSDILQSGLTAAALAENIASLAGEASVRKFIGIGPALSAHRSFFEHQFESSFYASTDEFIASVNADEFQREVILIKGARSFAFEKIVATLQRKIHGTVMEIDLGAMVHNLNFFRAGLAPGVKLMAMVKAFAYGSGSEEVANLLQYHGIDYLGVAYPDEGIDLRKNNIRLPILVMNPSEESFPAMISHNLEPEIYSTTLFRSFASFLNGRDWNIHLKVDTGMHRLGFEESEIDWLINELTHHPNIRIASIFSHLAGADESAHDDFTRSQAERFVAMSAKLCDALKIQPILHLLNSSGILRFPQYQFGMVRLGIGLYGVDPTGGKNNLVPVATLKSVISQIKVIKAGDSIGYGRKGWASEGATIATIAIGYADGFSRNFSRGVGEVLINGKLAPVVGNVCMDMTMIDVTDLEAHEGDEVIIFGQGLPIDRVAKKINTIPYEILTSTSERVKRVFYAESI